MEDLMDEAENLPKVKMGNWNFLCEFTQEKLVTNKIYFGK